MAEDLETIEMEALPEAQVTEAPPLRESADAPADSDPYADPRFQVPDDLVW